jgi:hypothetical protein
VRRDLELYEVSSPCPVSSSSVSISRRPGCLRVHRFRYLDQCRR